MMCPYCKSEETFIFYSAEMPNLLAACPKSMLPRVKSLPLQARLCRDCTLGFNSTPLSASELKEIYDDYLFISPLRGIGRTFYTGMIKTLQETYRPTDKIVEIGCSEGYILSRLRDLGYKNLTGIEPAPQADTARALGFKVIKEYFRKGLCEKQSVDGFYLMHVFEHFTNPFEVLDEMKWALSPAGVITIEVPHLEGFYHQHLYFFNMLFMKRLCRDRDLKIIRAETDDKILRVVLAHRNGERLEQAEFLEAPQNAIIARARANYRRFVEQVERLNEIVRAYSGKTVFWWGAGSSSVVYLNQLEPSLKQNAQIVVVDGDKNKWGCYVPGPSLPVSSFEVLQNREVECLVIASQFDNEIRQTLKKIKVFPKRIEVFV